MNPRRVAMGLSAALHLGVVVVAAVGLPHLPVRVLDDSPPIEVELVRVAERTTPPKPPEPKIEPKPQPVAEAPKPEPPRPEPPKVEPPKPEPVRQAPPEPTPAPTPKAKPAEVAPPPPPPVPLAKPKPPPEKDDSKAFDAGRIVALLNRMHKPEAPAPAPAPAPSAPAPPAANLQAPLTVSEIDLIRQQFYHCWSVPAGARDAADLVVRVRVSLNPDGSLRSPPELVDRSRINDTFWLAAAESALRAVRKCEPLRHLPPGKYERWREIELTFNPKDMLG